jgi:hypothetical protein
VTQELYSEYNLSSRSSGPLNEWCSQEPLFPGWLFWALLVPTSVVGALFYLSDEKELAYGVMGLFIVISMLASPQLAMYVFLAWQAWDGVFLPSPDAVLTPAKVMAFVVLLSYLIHIGRTKASISTARPVLLGSMIFAFYGLLTSIGSIAPLASIRYSLQIVVLVGVVFVGLKVIDTPERIRSALFWLVVGGTLAAIGVLAGRGSSQYSRGTLSENANPNSVAMALSVSLAAVPALWAFVKNKKFYYGLCIVCGALLMAGMMKTGSRSACGGIFLAYAIGGMLVRGHGWGKKILATGLSVLFSIGVFLYVLHLNVLPEKSQNRLMAMVGMAKDEGESSRVLVWKNAFKTYLNQPVIGVGFGNTAFAQEKYSGHFLDVHSSFIGPLVDGGIIGLILFLMILWQLFIQVHRIGIPNPGIPCSIMFASLVISCISHTIHFTKWFWIPVLVCVLLARYGEKVKRRREEGLYISNEYNI